MGPSDPPNVAQEPIVPDFPVFFLDKDTGLNGSFLPFDPEGSPRKGGVPVSSRTHPLQRSNQGKVKELLTLGSGVKFLVLNPLNPCAQCHC